jgi:hypothetical protein
MSTVVDSLLTSDEPSVRWKVRVQVLDEDPQSKPIRRLQQEIRNSPRVRALLDRRAGASYRKWSGGHWVLLALSDIGYPHGDPDLEPIAADVMRTWLAPRYYTEFIAMNRNDRQPGVAVMDGRHRRCGSQHGGALLAAVVLGLQTDACDQLVERVRHWQWPDGGWNCDRKLSAAISSVHETLLPMRGLAAYADSRSDSAARSAANRAAEALLDRRVIYRRSDPSRVVRQDWAKLHYPSYWYYDVLSAAKGLMEAGRLDDDRCQGALDLLESKRRPDGSFPVEGRHYNAPGSPGQAEVVGWDGDEWVTADALAVLHAAGRR